MLSSIPCQIRNFHFSVYASLYTLLQRSTQVPTLSLRLREKATITPISISVISLLQLPFGDSGKWLGDTGGTVSKSTIVRSQSLLSYELCSKCFQKSARRI